MQLQVVFTKCHKGPSFIKPQKWLIWIEVAYAWVRMDMIFCNVSCTYKIYAIYFDIF